MDVHCPNCDADLSAQVEAVLPDETDLTISLTITPGQLCMASTVAGVIENFAALQVELGRTMGCETNVFIAGLSYENDRIDITTRIVNAPSDSGSGPKGENSRSEVEGEAPQSGGASRIAQTPSGEDS